MGDSLNISHFREIKGSLQEALLEFFQWMKSL